MIKRHSWPILSWTIAALSLAWVGCDEPPADQPVKTEQFSKQFKIVRVDTSVSLPTQLAVHACAGLANRRLGGSVFVQTAANVPQSSIDGAVLQDELWFKPLGLAASQTVEAAEFVKTCVAEFGGCVRYSYATQHEILPSILTAAAALGVPPVATESPVACAKPTLDATTALAGKNTQLLATQYAYENFLGKTTGLAMLNPGYNRTPKELDKPDLSDDMPIAMIDLVFSRKLFVTFLINGCINGHPEKALLSKIIAESGWETPIGVFGYNDSWLVGGYVYEAQTRCLDAANMGAIPTRTTNLSFFDTRRAPITKPEQLPTNPAQVLTYNPQTTYVAFVIGDGDNVRYMMSTRKEWMDQRVAKCRDAKPACPPLTWTMSPHLPDLAPDVLQWYYGAAKSTGSDYFMLPPSGYQYAYPGMMPADVQASFASKSEQAAYVLSTRSVVHWEWFEYWKASVDKFMPRYAHKGGQMQGVFAVNVPYFAEAFPWWPEGDKYQVLSWADGGKLAVFRPQTWRGVDGSDDFHPTPQQMAQRLADLPKGTVTWVYMTSDGGLSLKNSYDALTGLLAGHVQLVSADAAAALALQAAAK